MNSKQLFVPRCFGLACTIIQIGFVSPVSAQSSSAVAPSNLILRESKGVINGEVEHNGLHVGLDGEWPEGTRPAVDASAVNLFQLPSASNVDSEEIKPGDGSIEVSGELRQWHKVTLTLDGPWAHERQINPNPFTDYRMDVLFSHESGKLEYKVPGYFAADGNAGQTSAASGTQWRAHLSPDLPGEWTYQIHFHEGANAAVDEEAKVQPVNPYHGLQGSFTIVESDKSGRDLRSKGRLKYVGKRYLQFAGTGEYFLKAGADAPETFLGYADFDNTIAGKPARVPLKTWSPHIQDWNEGDPTWKNGKGKGMIGALNYLFGKGCNVFSFLTYNAGGDGDNVWPFIERSRKLHYDCSKLDQWGIVFDHATKMGLYLHFKLQETEMDDNRGGNQQNGVIPTSLDGGKLGPERKLYLREIIARFGHALALNWNLGEENTQSTEEQQDMINYIRNVDPYNHHIVVHTYPEQQEKVYMPLIGAKSGLTGLSLQNSSIFDTHRQTVQWVRESTEAGKPWVVAFDESGNAAHAQVPDLGYQGFDGHDKQGKYVYTQHEVRKQTLWGTLMGGGAGCEYYFGYQLVENDLNCEDWRSRDQSWDYARIAIGFFKNIEAQAPFWAAIPADELVRSSGKNQPYCLAKPGDFYIVYLPDGGDVEIDLSSAKGDFHVQWFNPRSGGCLQAGKPTAVQGGSWQNPGTPPSDSDQDWAALIVKSKN